jgi:hypothetical protein
MAYIRCAVADEEKAAPQDRSLYVFSSAVFRETAFNYFVFAESILAGNRDNVIFGRGNGACLEIFGGGL